MSKMEAISQRRWPLFGLQSKASQTYLDGNMRNDSLYFRFGCRAYSRRIACGFEDSIGYD